MTNGWRNRKSGLLATFCVVLALGGASLASAETGAETGAGTGKLAPPLPVEDSGTAVLSAPDAHRLFLFDPYASEGAVVIDGDDAGLKSIGLITAARNASMSMALDGSKVYVGETYWTHGNRGDRQDLLSVYDGRTLLLDKEIPLPGRLLVVPKTQQSATSADGKLGYVYDMIPSSAIRVVDLANGKTLDAVDVPGCALAFPFGNTGVATLCGDGTMGVVDLAAAKPKVVFTKPFFDADKEPIFENSIVDRTTGEGWMLSFTGKIYPVKLGATAVVAKPWTLAEAASLPPVGTGVQELAWRPGGMQLMSYHRASKRLYVLMHAGNYWTHKNEGSEVWVLDTVGHKLLRRIRLDGPAGSIVVTQDDKPLLFAFGRSGMLTTYDALDGTMLRTRKQSGLIGLVKGW